MPGFALDTSCMIAAVCTWHEHHERAAAEVNRRLVRGTMIAPAPALVESYAVLTRLPPPHRLSAPDALHLLDASFMHASRTVALDGPACASMLRHAPDEAIVGGRIYDAVIAQCARKARATLILTFNREHFESLGIAGLEIVVP